MSIHLSVNSLDYDSLREKLQRGEDILGTDEHGNTVLHLLARHSWKQSLSDTVSGFFKPKVGLVQWIATIKNALHGKSSFESFASLRNNALDSCMHIAIRTENWEMAFALRYAGLFYMVYHRCLTRDANGLNEYELFLVRYGIADKHEVFNVLFEGFPRTLLDLKRATKAFKVVRLTPLNGSDKEVFLSPDQILFSKAVEEQYPSVYSGFPEESDLTALYEQNKLVDPAVVANRLAREEFEQWLKEVGFPEKPSLYQFVLDWTKFMRSNDSPYEFQRRLLYDFFCRGMSGADEFILEKLTEFERRGGCSTPSHREIFSQLVARCRRDASDVTGGK